MEKAAEANAVGGFPYFEDPVNVNEMLEKATVFVPALPCSDRTQDSNKRWQVLVYGFEFSSEERAS